MPTYSTALSSKIIGSLSNKALISLINALFGSNHPLDSEVRRLNTEQIDKFLKKTAGR